MKIEFEVRKIFSKGIEGPLSICNTIHELADSGVYSVSESSVKTVYGIYWSRGSGLVRPRNSGMAEKDFWITLYLLFKEPELGKKILNMELKKNGMSYMLSFNNGRNLYYVFLSYYDGNWHSNCSVDSRPAYAFENTVYLYNVMYFPLYDNNKEYLMFRDVYSEQPRESIQFTNIENM